MGANPALAEALTSHRDLLFGMCYRMLGNQADAEDLVQDTMARALARPPADLSRDPRAWLVRVAMNACRDHLRARKRRRDADTWLPSALATTMDDTAPRCAPSPEARYSQLESLSVAFLCAAHALSPNQRAVLLLRDVFDFSVRETSEALGLSEPNVKTTLHRARAAMASYEAQREPPSTAHTERARRALLALFFHVETGNQPALRELLTGDVVLVNDADDRLFAARRPVVGVDKALLFMRKTRTTHRQHARDQQRAAIKHVNGQPALVAEMPSRDGRLPQRMVSWVQLERSGRVKRVISQLNPDKLPDALFSDLPAVGPRALLDGLRCAAWSPPLYRWLPTVLRAAAGRWRRIPRRPRPASTPPHH